MVGLLLPKFLDWCVSKLEGLAAVHHSCTRDRCEVGAVLEVTLAVSLLARRQSSEKLLRVELLVWNVLIVQVTRYHTKVGLRVLIPPRRDLIISAAAPLSLQLSYLHQSNSIETAV